MNMALQQGGLGMILSASIITEPPMAGIFFNGVMGSYYSTNNSPGAAGAGGGGACASVFSCRYRLSLPWAVALIGANFAHCALQSIW